MNSPYGRAPDSYLQSGPTVIQRWNGYGIPGSVVRPPSHSVGSPQVAPFRDRTRYLNGPFESVGNGPPVVPILLALFGGALLYATFFGKKKKTA